MPVTRISLFASACAVAFAAVVLKLQPIAHSFVAFNHSLDPFVIIREPANPNAYPILLTLPSYCLIFHLRLRCVVSLPIAAFSKRRYVIGYTLAWRPLPYALLPVPFLIA